MNRTAPRTIRRGLIALGLGVTVALGAACSDDADAEPGFGTEDGASTATYEFTIPEGAGEALDAGTPLEILPATLETSVGETIEIVNLDDRGHNVGPWFVGADETVRQEFTAPGRFEGVCTVHPSGELVLVVEE